MSCSDDNIIYSINVEDVRRVVEGEGLRALTDDEIKAVSDKIGDYLNCYDVVLAVVKDVVLDSADMPKKMVE